MKTVENLVSVILQQRTLQDIKWMWDIVIKQKYTSGSAINTVSHPLFQPHKVGINYLNDNNTAYCHIKGHQGEYVAKHFQKCEIFCGQHVMH